MTEQQLDLNLIITESWQLPAQRTETISAFAQRIIDSRDWFAGDTLTIVGENGKPVLALGDEVVEGELVTLAEDSGRNLLLLARRLLDFGFGRITFKTGEDGVLRLVEVQLQLRPQLPAQAVRDFLIHLKTIVIPRIKAAYGAWWLPGQMYLRTRCNNAGQLESGVLTLSI